MTVQRPNLSNTAAVRSDDKYTERAVAETITGDWNFTGDFLLNGQPLSENTYVYVSGDRSFARGDPWLIDITHGLGTDNVMCELAVYDGNPSKQSYCAWASYTGQGNSWNANQKTKIAGLNKPPSSGQVRVTIANDNISSYTFRFILRVTALD